MSVSLVVLSLVFFGAVSSLFVSRQYELFNNKSITDEVKSISTELNNKTTKTTKINKVNDGTFFELLTDELKDIFDNIIKTETDVNNKIYDNRARDKYFKKVEKYDIHITDSNHINNDWISETLINKKIEDNLIIKEKKNKLKSKKNTKKNTIDISLHLEGF
jgi:hypothetical protein